MTLSRQKDPCRCNGQGSWWLVARINYNHQQPILDIVTIREGILENAPVFYRKNANVVPLAGNDKKPLVNHWKRWQKERQSKSEVDNFQWEDASGLAIINGPGGWHSLDIDDCDDEELVFDLLEELGLPTDYNWVVRSGGGFHVWFRSPEQSDLTVETFNSADPRCKQIELRWAGCYTAVPPSKHPSGKEYKFANQKPSAPPTKLSAQQVERAITSITEATLSPSESATEVSSRDDHEPWDGDPGVVEDALEHFSESFAQPPEYERWLKVASAVVDGIGESRAISMLEHHLPPIDEDGNDYRKKKGQWLEDVEVGTLFHYAKEEGWTPPWESSAASEDDSNTAFPAPVRASDVEKAKISWLWDQYVAEGMVHLLDGDPGTGKSTFLLGLAASLSNGKTPAGASIPPVSTLYISGEDQADTVLVPRYEAAGGDPDKFHMYDGPRTVGLTFPDSLPGLKSQIERQQIRLCVIDPFFSLLDRNHSKNAEQDVRQVLSAVSKVAEETGCTFFLVRHFNKKEDSSALYRGGGSIGITAQARLAYAFLKHPENNDERVLAWEKNNISKKDQTESLVFRMKGVQTEDVGEQPVVELDRTESLTAQELLNGKSRGRPPDKKNRAQVLIKEQLSGEARRPAGELYSLVEEEDFSKSTLRRAGTDLGVQKDNEGGTTYWSLPEEKQGFDIEPSA